MTQHQMQAADKRLNGTLRFADGRVSTDRAMQSQEGVERALKKHPDLRVAKDILRPVEATQVALGTAPRCQDDPPVR